MQLFRIAPERCLEDFSGLGSSYLNGARWNRPGQPVLYFACNASTALLEMANYLPSPRMMPRALRMGIYELDERASIGTLARGDLPDSRRDYPYPSETRTLGGDWLTSAEQLGLRVPSAATPGALEDLIVVNPACQSRRYIRLIDVVSQLYNEHAFSGV